MSGRPLKVRSIHCLEHPQTKNRDQTLEPAEVTMRTISVIPLSLLTAIVLLSSPPASADGWFSGSFGYDHRRHYGAYPHNPRGYPGRFRRAHRDSYFSGSSRYNRWRNYGRYSRYHNRRHAEFDASSLVGGIVLGSILSNAWQQASAPRYRTRTVVRSREVLAPKTVVDFRPSTVTRRRLLRDLAGNCYEISYTSGGSELRTQIDPSICDY